MMEWIIQRASTFAGEIDQIIMIVAVLGGFFLIATEAVLFYFVFRYHGSRRKASDYISGETKQQMKFIHWPHNIVLFCDVVILIFAVRTWYHVKQEQPAAPYATIRVVGHQWAWEFVDPGPDNQLGTADDVSTVDDLHIVVDKPYLFKLESADVLHSFSIPVFRLKQDAVPGRQITGWFQATKTGVFDVPCSQMCGIGHGIMGGRVTVETEEEHRKWLDSKKVATSTRAVLPNDGDKLDHGKKDARDPAKAPDAGHLASNTATPLHQGGI